MSAKPQCPICKRAVLSRTANPEFPFCSARCRAVDLGRWLGEEYRMADRSEELQEDGLPSHPKVEEEEA